MRHTTQALVLALALVPGAAAAQAPAARAGNPAARLLTHRAELTLTADQVKQLEAIDQRTAQQDVALRTKLEAVRGKPAGEPLRMRDMTPEQRQALQAKRAELQPVMLQLRAVHAQAAADARGVLTPEQNIKANALLSAGRGRGQGRGAGWAGRGRGWQGGPGAPGRGRGGWS